MKYVMNNIDKLLFQIPGADFKTHIEDDSNQNILFSGKFGSGKTTFIKHFFENPNDYGSEKYEYFHLFPVSYSISTNEDIIELIKYDIILEILKKGLPVYDQDIDNSYFFIKDHYVKIFSTLLSIIPKVGKDLSEVLDKIMDLKRIFDEHKIQVNATINEGDAMISFMEEIENKTGSIVDSSLLTKTIQKILKRNKEEKKIQNVLVLDDIDRIDPEHIFRILNVLAAHIDKCLLGQEQTTNKFGFDKVVIVCDIDNIRKIFRNKYGQNVDFSGYIDKFYSKQVFNFYTNYTIIKLLEEKIDDFQMSLYNPRGNYLKHLFQLLPWSYRKILIDFLAVFIDQNILSLRRILMINTKFKFTRPVEIKIERLTITFENVPELFLLNVIIYIVGGCNEFEEKISMLSKEKIPFEAETFQSFCSMLLWMSSYHIHRFVNRTQGEDVVKFNNYFLYVSYIERNGENYFETFYKADSSQEETKYLFSPADFLTLLRERLQLVRWYNFLQ